MRIVFGIKYFTLKSFYPTELNMAKDNSEHYTIEKQQRYFHLYWIPFFACGKRWVLRKNGELYELSESVRSHVESYQYHFRTPWYSFAGPLAILAGFLIYWISDSISEHQSEVRYQKEKTEEVEKFKHQISSPSAADYFKFYEIKNSGGYEYLKVESSNDTAVEFQLSSRIIEGYVSSPVILATYFSESPSSSDLVWINKKKLEKFVQPAEQNGNETFNGESLPTCNPNNRYKLEEIIHFEGGEIEDNGVGTAYNNQLSIGLTNKGLSTTITEIKTLNGNVKWTDPLPLSIGINQKFELHGIFEGENPTYKIELICMNKNKIKTNYILEGNGIEKTVTKE